MKKLGFLAVLGGMFILNAGCDKPADAPKPTPANPTTSQTKVESNGDKSTDVKTKDPVTGATAETKTNTPAVPKPDTGTTTNPPKSSDK